MIPKYNEMYQPFLNLVSDSKEHAVREIRQLLSDKYALTEEEKLRTLPSGKQRVFANRVGWCKSYLEQAKLIQKTSKGHFTITERGLDVLQKQEPVDNALLKTFPEFRDFLSRSAKSKQSSQKKEEELITELIEKSETPEETIIKAHHQLIEELASELLDEVSKITPQAFEKLVIELLISMGYGDSLNESGLVTPYTNDEGIDGIIKEDKLGFSNIYIQAKLWDPNQSVGRPEIQKFVGALMGQGAQKGLFITTAKFSKEARKFTEKNIGAIVVLIDGEQLAKLMIDNNLGVSITRTYTIKKIDLDYFEDV